MSLNQSIAQAESGNQDYYPNGQPVVSPKGAMYQMQVMPNTATNPGFGVTPARDNSPAEYDRVGRDYIEALHQHYGDLPTAITAYNWGPGNVDKYGVQNAPQETKSYVSKVLSGIGNLIIPSAGAAEMPQENSSFDVQMPDGTTIKGVPKGTTQTQLQSMLNTHDKTANAAPEQPGILSRIGNDISNRNQMVSSAVDRYQSGQQTLPETIYQAAGKGVAGTVNDVIGEGINSAAQYAPDFVRNAASSLMQTSPMQGAIGLINKGKDAYSQFEGAYPRAAANIDSAANIISAVPALEGIGAAPEAAGTALNKTGNFFINAADAQANKAKSAFVQDLITPKITPTVAADRFSRSSEMGIFRSAVVEPTAQEKSVIDTVSQLPVSDNKSLLANYNIISDANEDEAKSLIANLKKNDVAISDDHIINTLSDIRTNLAASPYITGDGTAAADKVLNIALDKISKNQQTATGLLQARKDFDAEIMRLKGAKTFDPTLDSPITMAVQQVRRGINDMVDKAVPSVAVKQSLQKQSNLYRAMENIETKGGNEGKNIFTRGIQKAASVLPVKGVIAKAALATGLTGAAAAAPALTATGLGLYGAGKALNSPFLKRGVGKTLRGTGKALGGK